MDREMRRDLLTSLFFAMWIFFTIGLLAGYQIGTSMGNEVSKWELFKEIFLGITLTMLVICLVARSSEK